MFLINTMSEWKSKGIRKMGFDFTDEELEKAKTETGGKGYIGTRNGLDCYLSEFVQTKKERVKGTYLKSEAPEVEIKVPKVSPPRTVIISLDHYEKVENLANYLNCSRKAVLESLIDQFIDQVY